METGTIIFISLVAIATISIIMYKKRLKLESENPKPFPSITPKTSATPIYPTPTPSPNQINECVCYVLAFVGPGPAVFSYSGCDGGLRVTTIFPEDALGDKRYVCAVLNSVACDSLDGTYSQAWGDGCPSDCDNDA
jgi:hypothetical protein